MAMVEPRWHHEQEQRPIGEERVLAAEERARLAEEQRLQAEGRCFSAERRRLDAERQLEQVQGLLREARQAGLRMQAIVAELGEIAGHLRGALEPPDERSAVAAVLESADEERRAEMADALAAAVERLRARVSAVDEVEPEPPLAAPQVRAPLLVRAPHKHSMSAISRWRNRWRNVRKQRQAA